MHRRGPVSCKICGLSFRNPIVLDLHRKKCHSAAPKPARIKEKPRGIKAPPKQTTKAIPSDGVTSDELLKPLNMGWRRELITRAGGQRMDVYYLSPDGKKLRSSKEIRCLKLPKGLTPENFSFAKSPLATKHPNEVRRKAGSCARGSPKVAADSKLKEKLNNGQADVAQSSKLTAKGEKGKDTGQKSRDDSRNGMNVITRKSTRKARTVPEPPKPTGSMTNESTETVKQDSNSQPKDPCFNSGPKSDLLLSVRSPIAKHAKDRWVPESARVVREPETFWCHHCGFSTSRKRILRSHMTCHTRNKRDCQYSCGSCGYRTETLFSLDSHKLVHSNYKPFECHHCGYKTKRFPVLKKHIGAHLGILKFKCKKCYFSSDLKSVMKDHFSRVHRKNRVYQCRKCDYTGPRHKHLKVHSAVKRFKCKYCDYQTAFYRDMRDHVFIHKNYKPFQCEFCEYKCVNAKALRSHVRKHTGEKPFLCEHCDYRTGYRSSLRKHLQGHNGVFRWKCDKCPYKTQHQSNYNYHIMTHKSKKARPHGCPHCHYRFINIYSLNEHMKRHTGEKPYQCHKCHMSWASRGGWKNHLRGCDPGHPARFSQIQPRIPIIIQDALSSDSDSDAEQVQPESESESESPLESSPLQAANAEPKRQFLETTFSSIIESNTGNPYAIEFIIDAFKSVENTKKDRSSSSEMNYETTPKSGGLQKNSISHHPPASAKSQTTLDDHKKHSIKVNRSSRKSPLIRRNTALHKSGIKDNVERKCTSYTFFDDETEIGEYSSL